MVDEPDDDLPSGGETPRRRMLYGRSKGKRLRTRHAGLMETLLPKVRIDVPGQWMPDGTPLDPRTFFAAPPRQVWFEVGFGGGEHLAFQAGSNPDVGFIGCEPFINGMAKLLALIDERALGNVRVCPTDAALLLERLAPASIDRLFILYPDPWPKQRHNKRRFISQGNLDLVARVLKPGGQFRFVSDIDDYVAWTLDHAARHGGFSGPSGTPEDWLQPPADWHRTRYEEKALREGRRGHYLDFYRKDAQAGSGRV
ncbi:MAG: tRNA (guanine(46)-N(7))-methyltransferase TrmB [Parvibaculaceae bacterium]|nr:tRNA (guanine(46)-N(7))-methyltransferase TrmB [Parvibaculaceae bacterium]